jgi:hypothetical protein
MSFNYMGLAIIFAGVSFGLTGVMMAAGGLFPEFAERYKKNIPTVISGIILVAASATIISTFGG